MTELVQTLNYLLALDALILQLAIIGLLALLFSSKGKVAKSFFGKYGMLTVFIVTLGSVVLTLVYSEVFGFVPCSLCWIQRMFLFPVVILSGIALINKSSDIADYIIWLSVPGAIVAFYQHYIQMGGSEFVNCPVATGADCTKRILFEFGYITFPLISFTVFIFLIVLMLFVRKYSD